jgi:beta-N-acetylhexosaminidase
MTNELTEKKPAPAPFAGSIPSSRGTVKLGCERLLESEAPVLRGKRVGMITNHTGVMPSGQHIVDAFRANADIKIGALFSPEHGFRGDAPAGKHVGHGIDAETGITVYSLYGEHRKPEKSMLEDIDVLVYDIQDVGARFYTYISTMTLAMEAAAENGIQFVVLDRPMVLSGDLIDGPVLRDDLRSFIGMLPIPVAYGLTPGELAGLVQRDYLTPRGLSVELHVVKLGTYSRSMWYDETGLPWVLPSPNIPTIETASVYPGTALIEGTNLSEGRGTPFPFQNIGAPFIDKNELSGFLNGLELPGVTFEPLDFTPKDASAVSNPKFKGQLCHGVNIRVNDRNKINPVEVGIALVCAIRKLYPYYLMFRADGAFDRLVGNRNISRFISDGADYKEIVSSWQTELREFEESRREFFLY